MKHCFRVAGKCKTGARTSSSCAHVATAVYALGLLAHDPAAWRTAWREYNYIDTGRPQAQAQDLLRGLFS